MGSFITLNSKEGSDTASIPRSAFTLIELLIVIAIVLILIAIALPNFLEAQIRAKVTKAKGEIRTVATALESYQIDWREYPWAAEYPDLDVPAFPPAEPIELHLPTVLTSPVAYMAELPADAFNNLSADGSDLELAVPYHYTEEETDERLGEPELVAELTVALFNRIRSARYFMLSHGPDNDHDEFEAGGETAIFSPTNGTKSNGDIFYFGPGIGFD